MRKERKKLRIVGDYMMVGAEKIKIDPTKGELPDLCKVTYAEMLTGEKYELEIEGNMYLEACGS